MNCVGIDVSKGKSMIAVMRPFGEVVISPFEAVSYTHLDVYKRQPRIFHPVSTRLPSFARLMKPLAAWEA